MARLLLGDEQSEGDQIEYHLRRSFTQGDRYYEAQYWYARQLFINKKFPEAATAFHALGDLPINPDLKQEIRGWIEETNELVEFRGSLLRLEPTFGFIGLDGIGSRVFLHRNNVKEVVWDSLYPNQRLKFNIGFTYKGPAAFNVSHE